MSRFDFEHFDVTKPEEFDVYIERLNCLFEARDTEETKKGVIFLSIVGADAYSIIRNLTAPELPSKLAYVEIVRLLTNYFKPKINVVAQRFKFHKRNQQSGESVQCYMNGLRKLAAACAYGDFLDQALRDQFVCGLACPETQAKCLSEGGLTLEQAIGLATSAEGARAGVSLMRQEPPRSEATTVAKVRHDPRQPKPANFRNDRGGVNDNLCPGKCYRCLSTQHKANTCGHKDSVCRFCSKKGHIERACMKKAKHAQPKLTQNAVQVEGGTSDPESLEIYNARVISSQRVGSVEGGTSDPESLEIYNARVISSQRVGSVPPYVTQVHINGTAVKFEIDTGAEATLVNRETWERCGRFALTKPRPLLTYTGEAIQTIGEGKVKVSNDGSQNACEVTVFVVASSTSSNLLGRDLLQKVQLDWSRIVPQRIARIETGSIQDICNSFPEVFSKDLGMLRNYQAKLYLKESARPRFFKPRTIAYGIKDKVETELLRLKSEGVLEPVTFSDWATPIVPVLKSDNSIRITGDYKVTLNPELHVDQFPLPSTREILATLGGCRYFSKIDLSQAFNQIELDAESRPLTTINTPWGLFRYTRLCFGVANAPAIFQKCIETVLQGISGVLARVDDILIATHTEDEHLLKLKNVLGRLQEHNLRVRRDKCHFLKDKITYLGYVLCADGVKPDPEKLRAIREMREPQNVTEVRSLCGFVNFYSSFIPNCSEILHPLYQLTKKGVHFKWDAACSQAFDKLKATIHEKSLLTHFDPRKPIKLSCDASSYGVGAVLSHIENGIEKPISFASRTLSKAEANYSQLERESLSIIFGITKFHDYLLMNHFTIETDHQPLIKIFGEHSGIPTIAASRLQRWAIKLSAHNYTIKYRKGVELANADLLSRLPLPQRDADRRSTEGDVIQAMRVAALPVTAEEVGRATREDPILSKVMRWQRHGWPETFDDEFKPFHSKRNELTIEQDVLLWGIRVVVPECLRDRVLSQLHATHPGICRMKGIARTHAWWPKIDEQIEFVVRNCNDCQMQQPLPAAAPVHPLVWPNIPWYRLHLDYAGPFHGRMWLILVDATSKWAEIIPLKEANSRNTILALESIFARFGLPHQLFSDNGTPFTSDEFKAFCEERRIAHIRSTPWHPRSNGEAERMVRTFKMMMKKENPASSEIMAATAKMLATYRTTPHATTGVCPYELLFKIAPRTIMDCLHPSTESRVLRKQMDQAGHSRGSQKDGLYSIGERVFVRDFRARFPNKWVEGTVTNSRGPLSYLVQVGSEIWRRHVDQMRGADPSTLEATIPPGQPGLQQPTVQERGLRYERPAPTESEPTQAAAAVTGNLQPAFRDEPDPTNRPGAPEIPPTRGSVEQDPPPPGRGELQATGGIPEVPSVDRLVETPQEVDVSPAAEPLVRSERRYPERQRRPPDRFVPITGRGCYI